MTVLLAAIIGQVHQTSLRVGKTMLQMAGAARLPAALILTHTATLRREDKGDHKEDHRVGHTAEATVEVVAVVAAVLQPEVLVMDNGVTVSMCLDHKT